MPQEKDWLWIAYPSGYDYAQWGLLEKSDPTLLEHLERQKGSYFEDSEYKYRTTKQPHYDYSVSRKPKSRHAIAEHIRLIKFQDKFNINEDLFVAEGEFEPAQQEQEEKERRGQLDKTSEEYQEFKKWQREKWKQEPPE